MRTSLRTSLFLLVAALATGQEARSGDEEPCVVERVLRESGSEIVLRVDGPMSEARIEALYRHFDRELLPGQRLRLFALDPEGRRRPLESSLPRIEPPPSKPFEGGPDLRAGGRGGLSGGRSGEGFLAGKTVFLSPGHGWYHDPSQNRWETQRPVTNELVEDFHNADAVRQFLVTYLENAGADVWVARERDANTEQRIVDDGDGDPNAGTYEEIGSPGRFLDSSYAGYGHVTLPYDGSTNPLDQGAMRLMQTTSGAPDASVVWTPNLPEDGDYAVYVSYGAWVNRPDDAHYRVSHRGGAAELRIDQRRDGFTWRYLGTFPFRSGYHPGEQAVVLFNDTADPVATHASVDAVRFGGGDGQIDLGDGVSGRPRVEECARYSSQYAGGPPSVYQYYSDDRSSDVVARPRHAAWENEAGEDSVYFSWHTNAPDPATGTSSYIYSSNPTAGSDVLQSLVHEEVIGDLRAGYDSGWVDRGQRSAAFGELNPAHNGEMPALLMEIAFHDTPSDALVLKDARFLEVAARGIAQGIARYFALMDGTTVRLAPEPPRRLRVEAAGSRSARVSWDPPASGPSGLLGDPPEAYRVYVSAEGRAFGPDYVEVSDSSVTLSGLNGDRPSFVRVVSVNAGGRSVPSPTLALLLPGDRPDHPRHDSTHADSIRTLFVHGFTRTGPYLLPGSPEAVDGAVPVTASATGTLRVERCLREEVNTFDYAVEHALALATVPGLTLESATREAVANGDVALTNYELVVWSAGEQAEVHGRDMVDDASLDAAERALLESYLAGGGALLISGAEIAYDLDRDADPNDPESTFLHEWLKASYVSDTARTHRVLPGLPGPLENLPRFRFDNGDGPAYDVEWPDRISPLGGAADALSYRGGRGGTAATFFSGGYRVLYLGFPFETIRRPGLRARLMRDAVRALVR